MTSARAIRLAQDVRSFSLATAGDPDLGPFQDLPGTWTSGETGWNMIALPFGEPGGGFRLLLNQYKEHLTFSLVDKAIPNRGAVVGVGETDQTLLGLDYEQLIKQVATVDSPASDLKQSVPAGIHHEPGLFLNMLDRLDPGEPSIARLATIPHGDSVLALGDSGAGPMPSPIPHPGALPVGVDTKLTNPYMKPYADFHTAPFKGTLENVAQFPGFDPTEPQALLDLANDGVQIVSATTLHFSTANAGGISNIPFVVKQANATFMEATFWIQKLVDGSLRMQYLQKVVLEFLPRKDGTPGLIGWPHISINTLTKTSDDVVPDPNF